MADASSRIEAAASVQGAARLANQRMLEMLTERVDAGAERPGAENALDKLRKDIADTLQAAASKTAGSAQTDPAAAATDPTTLPTAARAGGNGSNDGILVQLDPVLQQAALLMQQGSDATRQLASALLDRLAANGGQMLTAGDGGTRSGNGFMPGSHPWLQLPDSFSTRSTLPDIATKSEADGSLNQSGGEDPASARERSQTTRALAGGVTAGRSLAGPLGAAAARRIAQEFNLTLQQAAGVVAGALHAGARGAAAEPGARGHDAHRRRTPGSGARRQRLMQFSLLQQLDPETPQAACSFAVHELRNELAGLLPLLRRARSAEEAMEMLRLEIDGDAAPAGEQEGQTVRAILDHLGPVHTPRR